MRRSRWYRCASQRSVADRAHQGASFLVTERKICRREPAPARLALSERQVLRCPHNLAHPRVPEEVRVHGCRLANSAMLRGAQRQDADVGPLGRTGWMGRAGRAVTLLTPEDVAKWRQFERMLGRKLQRQQWAQRVGTAAACPAAAEWGAESRPHPQGAVDAPRAQQRPAPPAGRARQPRWLVHAFLPSAGGAAASGCFPRCRRVRASRAAPPWNSPCYPLGRLYLQPMRLISAWTPSPRPTTSPRLTAGTGPREAARLADVGDW
jgi:hypothetical protein